MPDICPHCATDLQGDAIPQEYIDKGWYGTNTHYSRKIGVEIRGVYDGVLFWQCPDCGGRWHRFSEGPLRVRAESFIHGSQQ